MTTLIKHFCLRDDLSTYDPYDIWKTALGFQVKKLFNRNRRFGVVPAGALAMLDVVNNGPRKFYTAVEYPIVRAFAALCLVNLNRLNGNEQMLRCAGCHLRWLLDHACKGYKGLCWGLGVPNAIGRDLVYDSNAPFSTITPYILEAFVAYAKVSPNTMEIPSIVGKIYRFFDEDLQPMEEDEEVLATSYGPFRDRKVINAVSYTMYSYALCLPYISGEQRADASRKIEKLYGYLRRHQRPDGSWLYSPDPGSFIDCFHSCIVLKNIVKTSRLFELHDSAAVVSAGYDYIRAAFLDEKQFLFKRFSIKNKPGLIQFDLYDNAEVLNLAFLLNDRVLFQSLLQSVIGKFCDGMDVYSQVTVLGTRLNRNTLRWAVMPFLYAASSLLSSPMPA